MAKSRPTARRRRRIPWWPFLAVGALVGALLLGLASRDGGDGADGGDTPDLLAVGEQIYGRDCASCHGAEGEGRFGPPLAEPETDVLTTFTDLASTMEWIRAGSAGTPGDTYGGGPGHVPKPKGPQPMVGFPELTDQQLEAVATYVRQELAGEEAAPAP